jgi:hypothetical protein
MPQDATAGDRNARSGTHGLFHWLTVTGDVYMGDVVRLLPEAILNRHLAVTSYDSGIRRLSAEEMSEGWVLEGDIAYSPRITGVEGLEFQRDSFDGPGYDEWYVFLEPPPRLGALYHGDYFEFRPGSGELMAFVSSPAFLLHDPDPYLPGILDLFWDQLVRVQPDAFIADGQECLTLVSKDPALIRTAEKRLTANNIRQ